MSQFHWTQQDFMEGACLEKTKARHPMLARANFDNSVNPNFHVQKPQRLEGHLVVESSQCTNSQ